VVVAGTMRELGGASRELHREVAARIAEARPDLVAAVGEFVPAFESLSGAIKRKRLLLGATPDAVAPLLKARLQPGDVVLLKASRGVQLERIVPLLWPSYQALEEHR
jgi:UDP-N-acetylmuramoyl-tripeptide--D-alanyl-D-alanine ligase